MAANGMLAGLVAITAPCAFVAPWAASLIGIVAGFLVCYGVWFFDHVVHVDDPCGAISVHGVCGAWGVLAVGIFADGTYGDGWNGVKGPVKGLLYGDGGQMVAQVVHAVGSFVWAVGITFIIFTILKRFVKLRVSPEVELDGLDMHEFGALCYPDFVLATTKTGGHAPTSSPSVPGYPPSASAFTSEPGTGPGGTLGGQS
jgi:Amt family ammonium transporter